MWLMEPKRVFFNVTNLKQKANRTNTAERIKGVMCCMNPFEQLKSNPPYPSKRKDLR